MDPVLATRNRDPYTFRCDPLTALPNEVQTLQQRVSEPKGPIVSWKQRGETHEARANRAEGRHLFSYLAFVSSYSSRRRHGNEEARNETVFGNPRAIQLVRYSRTLLGLTSSLRLRVSGRSHCIWQRRPRR